MAQSGFAALFLFLGLVVSDVYGENATICETILNATLSSANLTDFKLTVSPTTLLSKTDYTVSLEGTGNFTIFLQASSSSNPVGNWSQDVTTCKGSPLFNESFPNGKSINTTWTSPENVTSVTISAYIQNDTETFRLEKILIHVSNETTSATTVATTSATVTSHTESTQTAKGICYLKL
ncbi:hypothetical protein GDO81_014284 [Engystomops pustulosus]|uniref:Placenta-expressed transcript 1 protein n=1 Tax=Engystomops pustulosus TaxID=76066 RepID=A0AAV7B9J1_ENGPU|nr:hypothetical protein GDO81_014284 [Engystomops pustulosus]